MPLSMTLNRSDETPLVTPCFDGKELHIDSELVSAGLSAISVKGCDAGDPREEVSIRHRNSFWSVHRPELSKLNWASNNTSENIENFLKLQAGNQYTNKEFTKSDIPPADLNKLTVIHTNSNHRDDTDDDNLLVSEPQTTQFSDDDLASHTTLHKSRAEFCVTIGHIGKQLIADASEPCSSKIVPENSEEKNLLFENDMAKITGWQSSDRKMGNVSSPGQKAPMGIQQTE